MFRASQAQQVARQLSHSFDDLDVQRLAATLRRTLKPAGVVGMLQGGVSKVLSLGSVPRASNPAELSFEIASVTKPFTAALAFRLAQQGRLELEAPLSQQFSSFRGYPPHITARALMTHTSGLPVHPLRSLLGAINDFHNPYGLLSSEQVLASGRRWSWLTRNQAGRLAYTNFGYGLLALALSEAAGQPYPLALRRWIIEPLGLMQTGFAPSSALAVPHHFLGSQRVSGFGGLTGAGGLYSSAHDLLRFGQAHLSGAVRGWPDVAQPPGKPAPLLGVASGWFVVRWQRGAVWWHDGVARGTRVSLGFSPDTGRVAVVLVSSGVPVLGNRWGPTALLAELL